MERSTPHSEWLKISEACLVLKGSRRTLYTYMKSGDLSYYQLRGSGHRRIRAEDLQALLIPGVSQESDPMNGVPKSDLEGISTQESQSSVITVERDYSWMPEYYEDLEGLRPLEVWAGHPCAECGAPLRGVVPRETVGVLLKDRLILSVFRRGSRTISHGDSLAVDCTKLNRESLRPCGSFPLLPQKPRG